MMDDVVQVRETNPQAVSIPPAMDDEDESKLKAESKSDDEGYDTHAHTNGHAAEFSAEDGTLSAEQQLQLFEMMQQKALAQMALAAAQAGGFQYDNAAFLNNLYSAARFANPFPSQQMMAAAAAALFANPAAATAPATAGLQSKPLSLKVERGGAATNNPPSGGSSGGANQASPSTSSTSGADGEPDEPEDLSMNVNSPGDDGLEDGHSESVAANGNQSWSFEEQFKQLYELSDDPKRKEFLDELFSFMQKRGSPVTRIPIMAKQVLDLYELYRLVVHNGGLVEVINKKLWREITKGLNLPSSITSAAFTLRTQYMKYLYPFECAKENRSTAAELQAAIDGNRREGRRTAGFNPYAQLSPTLLANSAAGRHVNGNGLFGTDDDHMQSPADPRALSHSVFTTDVFRQQALALEVAKKQLDRTQSAFRSVDHIGVARHPVPRQAHLPSIPTLGASAKRTASTASSNESMGDSPAPLSAKRHAAGGASPFATIGEVSFKYKYREKDNSIHVHMEFNGTEYDGILFPPKRLITA